ncbi:Dabb family protein [Nocardia thailandica]|uniref:Dabb family protein n=1 Tax=Nocardia thailandica TaxID=257275 RepID=UPI0005B8A20B|nr:Dabb family protein [Nocardia thailandica]
MSEVVRLLHLASPTAAAAEALCARLRPVAAAAGASRILIAPTLPGVRNGGDVLLRLRFPEPAARTACARAMASVLDEAGVTRADGAEYTGGGVGYAAPGATGTVYRTLLLRVAPGTPPETIAGFEADLLRMPAYLPGLRAWQLSRVTRPSGAGPWTHVWEQEFADLAALTGPYLAHPVHWGLVDRWFDPEFPQCVVRDRVCHSYCATGEPVLS